MLGLSLQVNGEPKRDCVDVGGRESDGTTDGTEAKDTANYQVRQPNFLSC